MSMIRDELPNDTIAAHALIRQKLNEHAEAIGEVRKENLEQNRKIDRLEAKIDDVKRDTAGIVEVVHFSRKFCRLLKWMGAAAGAAGAIIGFWQAYMAGWLS